MYSGLRLVFLIGFATAYELERENLCSTCECKKKLLDCNYRNLSSLPSLKNASNFTTVSFAYNSLTQVTQFPRSSIRLLSFGNNEIVKITDSAFANLAQLAVLDLNHNLLTTEALLPNVFRGKFASDLYEPLRNLKELNIAYNKLHTLHPDIFEHLPNLEIVKLNGNPLKTITQGTVVALSSIPQLKELHMSRTYLKQLPENLLHAPKYLEALDLSDNLFTEAPKEIENSHRLRWLSLNGNPFKRIENFLSLPFLKELHLSRMREMQSIENRSLSKMPLLEQFHCTDNRRLTKIDGTVFSAIQDDEEGETWPPLKVIVLSNNSLRTIDSHLVSRWDNLETIDLRHNPWMCDCENQWLVSTLAPIIEKIQPEMASSLKCGEPTEMKNRPILDLYHRDYEMRCLDLYGHTPENDGKLLIGICVFTILLSPFLMAAAFHFKNKRQPKKIQYHQMFSKDLTKGDHLGYSQLRLFPVGK